MFFTSRAFWTDFLERVVSTGAAGALTVVTLAGFHVFTLSSWRDVAGAAGVAALISALKALSLQRTGAIAAAATGTSIPAPASQPDLLERLASAPTMPAAAPTTPAPATDPAPAATDTPTSLASIGLV
jgi:hypothetical protein